MAHVTSPGGSVVASSAQPHLRRERLIDRCFLTRDKRGRAIVAAGMEGLEFHGRAKPQPFAWVSLSEEPVLPPPAPMKVAKKKRGRARKALGAIIENAKKPAAKKPAVKKPAAKPAAAKPHHWAGGYRPVDLPPGMSDLPPAPKVTVESLMRAKRH